MDGFDEVGFALARFDFDDLECVVILVEFGLDFMYFGEPSRSDAAEVDEVLFEVLCLGVNVLYISV
jgi:hypothetical protein